MLAVPETPRLACFEAACYLGIMQMRAGTSGFSYTEWKGTFYPDDLPQSKMLAFYVKHLPSVEINNTFYRMPKAALLEKWRDLAPEGFRFAIKAPRRITHSARLKEDESRDPVAYLLKVTGALGSRLGPILFQLPPFLKRDVARLRGFLTLLPEGSRVGFEFRHPSWFADDTYEALQERNAALCGGDVDDEAKSPPLVATASWGYLRLRRSDYSDAEIAVWAERIAGQSWTEAYAFFKHEQKAPELARLLNDHFGRPGVARTRPGAGVEATGTDDAQRR